MRAPAVAAVAAAIAAASALLTGLAAAEPPAPTPAPTAGTPAAEPAFADVLARAAAEGRPLVVELGATWCKPCVAIKALDGDPAVERARGQVVFARYDLDRPAGAAVAARFGVRGVPAFLVIDASGQVVDRWTSAPADGEVAGWLAGIFDDTAIHARVAAGGPASAADRARAEKVGQRRTFARALGHAVRAAGHRCAPGDGPRSFDVFLELQAGQRGRVVDVLAPEGISPALPCLLAALERAKLPALPSGASPLVPVTVELRGKPARAAATGRRG